MKPIVVMLIIGITKMASGVAMERNPQPRTTDSAGQARDVKTETALPVFPRVQPATMAGFDDDAAYRQSIADQVAELAGLADGAKKTTRRIDFLLAAANEMLAHQLEAVCTERLLDMPTDSGDGQAVTIRQPLDRADALLAQADQLLKDKEQHDPKAWPADWLSRTTHGVETLHRFSTALRAFLLSGDAAKRKTQVQRAASGLSPLLEDENPAVASAATLWQACLRRLEDDPTRALNVLDLALADPVENDMPYAFFSRLLRCRLVADRGGPAAALALLTQVEERCDDWLHQDKDRQDALRATRFVQARVVKQWYDRLNGSDQSAERHWCAQRMAALIKESFGDDKLSVLRLTPVIPIVAPVPSRTAPASPDSPKGG